MKKRSKNPNKSQRSEAMRQWLDQRLVIVGPDKRRKSLSKRRFTISLHQLRSMTFMSGKIEVDYTTVRVTDRR